jgi:ribosomal-protein-alanine N-acetyltransferase
MHLESPLHGEHSFLRTLNASDDLTYYHGWLLDPDVNKYLEVRFSLPQGRADISTFIRNTNNSEDSLLLGIFKKTTGKHIGNIKLGPINRHHSTAEVGFLIGDKAEWNRGHASAAISLVTEYAFRSLGVAKITAGCYVDNEGSRRAFKRAGYAEEGRRFSQWNLDGVRQDALLFGKVNPDYL